MGYNLTQRGVGATFKGIDVDMKTKQCFILGGGCSLKEGIDKGLWDKLQGKFTMGLNYSYNFFDSTMLCCVDYDTFYKKNYEELKKLPLIVSQYNNNIVLNPIKGDKYGRDTVIALANSLFYKNNSVYNRNLKEGVYKVVLVGIFALSIAIFLLDEGEIFLLGYDHGGKPSDKEDALDIRNVKVEGEDITDKEVILDDRYKRHKNGRTFRAKTHWYQDEIDHKGVGRCSFYYEKNPLLSARELFKPFEKEKKIKIYNVSEYSKITNFDKLSYDEFFSKIDNSSFNQDELRLEIKTNLIRNTNATRL